MGCLTKGMTNLLEVTPDDAIRQPFKNNGWCLIGERRTTEKIQLKCCEIRSRFIHTRQLSTKGCDFLPGRVTMPMVGRLREAAEQLHWALQQLKLKSTLELYYLTCLLRQPCEVVKQLLISPFHRGQTEAQRYSVISQVPTTREGQG